MQKRVQISCMVAYRVDNLVLLYNIVRVVVVESAKVNYCEKRVGSF